METIKVAVIDSGIYINHCDLYYRKINAVELISEADRICIRNCTEDANGHGTAIAGIIFNKCDTVEMLSIKILNKNLKCSFDMLCYALELSIEENVNIINLSLGTIEKKHESKLQRICERAFEQGIYIIASFHNTVPSSFPASFSQVFGIISGKIPEKYGYMYNKDRIVYANGSMQKVCDSRGGYRYNKGNSLAGAHFTGILAKLLSQEPGLTQYTVDTILKKNSLKTCSIIDSKEQDGTSWIKKALLYPITKENLDMLKQYRCLDHEIIGLYDEHTFYQAYWDCLDEASVIRYKIYEKLEEGLKNADTLLIGDLSFLSPVKRHDVMKEIAVTAVKMGKNIYSKDLIRKEEYPYLYQLANKKGVRIESKYL